MKAVRIGIIGLGNIGRHHAGYLLAGRVARCQLTAVCSSSSEKLAEYSSSDVAVFSDPQDLIHSGAVDAVLIATPHYQHVEWGIAAFAAGLHVLVEKPIAAHKAAAERLISAHQQRLDLKFAGMFQMRTEPRYQIMRSLLSAGEIGAVVRVNWLNTDWFRSEAYYASSAWRATWSGEGGGVLLNQCLHNLDVLQWLLGMPVQVRGFCQFGRFHRIEVEDSVTAYLEWSNQATGVFVSSTGEAPGANRLEIVGTRGTLLLENGKLVIARNAVDMLEFSRSAKMGFSKPESQVEEIPFGNATAPHAAVVQNFVNAILDGEPLLAPGAEGIHSLELANALVYSSLIEATVQLPLDAAAWEARLARLIAESRFQKPLGAGDAGDVENSFRR